MIPFVEQRSYLDIEQFSTDVRTSEAVPTLDFINVRADAVVKLKIGTTDEMIARLCRKLLELEYDRYFQFCPRCLGRKLAGSDRSDGAP